MRNYNFNKLLDSRTFEFFGKSIIEKIENKRFEIFSEGRDLGIDLRCVNEKSLIIVQIKRFKDFNSLYNELKNKELQKVEKIKPNRYILITSVELSVIKKEKIKEIFKEYIVNTSDIIGSEDLNSLLEKEEFRGIEEEYYQLWINSTSTLKNFIKRGLNSDIYAYTGDELENIKDSTKMYVKNESFNQSLKLIKKNKCLLICGEAGIGKSMLARNLCAYILNKYRETEFIYLNKISDVAKLLTEGKRQLFFIDDFWGSKFADNLKGEEENILKRIIKIINKSEDKILILTCREYILEQGCSQYQELTEFFNKYKLKLNIEKYSKILKAQILFQHLQTSELPHNAIYEIAYGYENIIENPNYNPRIIENYIRYVSEQEIEPNNYLKDFIEYLENPNKLWKEVFSKQREGAQLILIIMLLSKTYEINLENVRKYFNSYIDVEPRVEARKKEFGKYISELENNLINTYKDDESNKIFVKFKNSSIELYVYKYLMENLEEYANGLIQGAISINNLLYLTQSWDVIEKNYTKAWEYEKIYNRYKITKEFKDKVIQKLMKDYKKLKVFVEDEGAYKETEENYVHKLVLLIHFYKLYLDEDFKQWLKEKIKLVLNDLEKNKYFIYEDLFEIPILIKESITNRIYTQIDIQKVIKEVFNAIRFSEQILTLKSFKESFPNEYNIFWNENALKVKTLIYNLTIDDASYFLSDLMYDELDELIEYTIPYLFKEYDLKYTKEYLKSFYNMTGIKLQSNKEKIKNNRNELKKDANTEKEIEKIWEEKQKQEKNEKQQIEKLRNELFDNLTRNKIEKNQIETFLQENLIDKKLKEPLMQIFNNENNKYKYILSYIKDIKSLKILVDFINSILYIPKNSKDFFENLIIYIQKENINITEKIVDNLQQVAYKTFQKGENQIYKNDLLTYIKEKDIEELEKVGIIYLKRKKYYFHNDYLLTYLAIKEMIRQNENLESLYNKIGFRILYEYSLDMYADIDIYDFNKKILIPKIRKIIKLIQNEKQEIEIKKIIDKYDFEIDLDFQGNPEENCIYQGGSLNEDFEIIILEYLGFDMWNFIDNIKNIDEIRKILKDFYEGKLQISIKLKEAFENKQSIQYMILEKIGTIDYIKYFCEGLQRLLQILEINPKFDFRKGSLYIDV